MPCAIFFSKVVYAAVALLSFDFLGRSDSLVLGVLSSLENVAKYNIASILAGMLNTISLSISMFLLTRNAELVGELADSVFHRSLRIAFSLNLISGILLVSLIPLILRFFFPQYIDIGLFVALLSCSAVFYSVYFLYVTRSFARMAPKTAAKVIIVSAGLNLVLDLLLIPPLGLLGICLATFLVSFVAFVMCEIDSLGNARWMIVLSPVFIFFAFFLGSFGILLAFPVGLLLFYSGSITKEDAEVMLRVFKQVVGKIRSLGRA